MVPLLATTSAVIAISAICSLCEAVLYSVPATWVAQLEEEGRPSGKVLAKLREHVDEPITAILTLNTIANTAGAAVCGALAGQALSERNVLVFSAALTVAILLFSEILPKTIGVVFSRSLAPLIAHPLRLAVFLLKPLIFLISLVTRLFSTGGKDGVSQEEILSLTRMGHRAGAIDADEAAVIENVLALPDTTVREIMTPRTVVFALDAETSVRDACAEPGMMVHSRVPVYADELDVIVGMVFRRDLLAVESEDGDRRVAEFLRPAVFIDDQATVDGVLKTLLENKRHMVMVLDEFGGFAGVVTLEDVMETILGKEIVDEFDEVADLREVAMNRREAALKRMRER